MNLTKIILLCFLLIVLSGCAEIQQNNTSNSSDEIQKLQSEIARLKDQLQTKIITIEPLKEEKTCSADLESTSLDLRQAEIELSKAKFDLKNAQEDLDEAEEDIKDDEEIKQAEEEVEEAEDDLEAAKLKLDLLLNSTNATQLQIQSAKDNVDDEEEDLNRARADLDDIKEQKDSELVSFKNNVELKKITYDANKKKVETLDNALIELQKSCQDEALLFYNKIVCKKELAIAERAVSSARDNLDEEEKDLEDAEDELDRLKTTTASLQVEIDDAEDDVEKAKGKVEEARERKEEAEYKLNRLNKLCSD